MHRPVVVLVLKLSWGRRGCASQRRRSCHSVWAPGMLLSPRRRTGPHLVRLEPWRCPQTNLLLLLGPRRRWSSKMLRLQPRWRRAGWLLLRPRRRSLLLEPRRRRPSTHPRRRTLHTGFSRHEPTRTRASKLSLDLWSYGRRDPSVRRAGLRPPLTSDLVRRCVWRHARCAVRALDRAADPCNAFKLLQNVWWDMIFGRSGRRNRLKAVIRVMAPVRRFTASSRISTWRERPEGSPGQLDWMRKERDLKELIQGQRNGIRYT